MFNRRTLIAILAGVAATTGAASIAGATPAAAAPTCSVHATIDPQVSLRQGGNTIATKLDVTKCPYTFDIAASAGADGDVVTTDLHYTNANVSDSFVIRGANDPAGVYSVSAITDASTVTDSSGNPVPLTFTSDEIVAKYTSWAYIAGSRQGKVLYVNGLFKRYTRGGSIVGDTNRDVYLQRYVTGRGWQTIVHRKAGATGHLTVGFIQPKVQQYRWVDIEQAMSPLAAWGAISGGIVK